MLAETSVSESGNQLATTDVITVGSQPIHSLVVRSLEHAARCNGPWQRNGTHPVDRLAEEAWL
jgi:hypothetical protein